MPTKQDEMVKTKHLTARYEGAQVGTLEQAQNGRLSFTYDEVWRNHPSAFPLSLSMPLAAPKHEDHVVDGFLWGLLPDNPETLQGWAREFKVSPRSAFSLITHVGADCAGAIQFLTEDSEASPTQDDVEWLDETDVGHRIDAVLRDPSATRLVGDEGQFSLAGAQEKIGLLFDGERWGLPKGRIPTTHILKAGLRNMNGHAENEVYCMRLAQAAGLETAEVNVRTFAGHHVVVATRYDRTDASDPLAITRIHQEDFCQALGLHPDLKYEKEGGPGAVEILELLATNATDPERERLRFLAMLAFNWIIGGSDAHAKNYSILIKVEGRVELAPFYDVASLLPYPDRYNAHKTKMAMRIGREYVLDRIGARQWQVFAEKTHLSVQTVGAVILVLTTRIAQQAAAVAERMRDEGCDHPILSELVQLILARAVRCADVGRELAEIDNG